MGDPSSIGMHRLRSAFEAAIAEACEGNEELREKLPEFLIQELNGFINSGIIDEDWVHEKLGFRCGR